MLEDKYNDLRLREFLRHVELDGERWPLQPLAIRGFKERPYNPTIKWSKTLKAIVEFEEIRQKPIRKQVLDAWFQKDRRPFYALMNNLVRKTSSIPTQLSWNQQVTSSRRETAQLAVDYWKCIFFHPGTKINFHSPHYYEAIPRSHNDDDTYRDLLRVVTKRLGHNKAVGLDGIHDKWLRQYCFPKYTFGPQGEVVDVQWIVSKSVAEDIEDDIETLLQTRKLPRTEENVENARDKYRHMYHDLLDGMNVKLT